MVQEGRRSGSTTPLSTWSIANGPIDDKYTATLPRHVLTAPASRGKLSSSRRNGEWISCLLLRNSVPVLALPANRTRPWPADGIRNRALGGFVLRLCFVHLGLFASFGAGAASAQSTTSSTPPEFVSEGWTVENGLPVNEVNQVLQGHDGYLWLATWDGLVRFDGARFTVFNVGNSEGLPSNRIADVIESADGSLWLRTGQFQLVRMRDGVFTHITEEHGLRDGTTRMYYIDDDARLWIGSDSGVFTFDGERFVPVADQWIDGSVEAVLRDRAGNLWVGTQNDGLYRIAQGTATRFDTASGLGSNWITALREDRSGTIWIGTGGGVDFYRGDTIQNLTRDNGDRSLARVLGLRGHPTSDDVWVSTEEGVYVARNDRLYAVVERAGEILGPRIRFDSTGTAWYAFGDRLYHRGRFIFQVPARASRGQHLTGQIQAFTWDHEGSLWIGTMSRGLYRLKPSLFRVYSDAEGVAFQNVTSIIEDNAGVMWIGTRGGGLSRLADGRITSYTPAQGYPSFVLSVMQDRSGHLWAGTTAGIEYCRLPAMACGAPPGGDPEPRSTVLAIHQDSTGDVWGGTDRGLFRLQNGQWTRMAVAELPQSSVVRAFLQGRDGTLWMGTSRSGILAYRDGRFARLSATDGLPSDLVRALHEDESGQLWVGTEGRGLARVTVPAGGPPRNLAAADVRPIRQRDGLFDEVIHQILDDGLGRLWMSTNRGIFWVTLDELNAFADGRISRIHSTAYTERDGLRNREANGGTFPAGIRSRDGRLWFATQDGAVVVDPNNARPNLAPPPVVVEQLVARGRVRHGGSAPVELSAEDRNFEIDYTALSFMAPENVRFRYRLEGRDREWVEAGNRRSISYTNVPPGRYTFRVIASNNDGVWNETGAALPLRVAPYFYETRTAYLLLALSIALLGSAGFQWRVRRLKRRERELTQLVETRTLQVRQHEAQLEAQNAQLAVQAEKLTELDRAKSRLFANVSHEFRTPLTLIMGPLRAVLDGRHGALNPSLREQGELMLRNSQRLLRLINQILDLAKLQAGEVAIDRQPNDLVAFVREVTLAFAPLAERRGIVLVFRTALPELVIPFDAGQLEKVLLNLLSNALKFTDVDGRVEVSVNADPAAAEIAVTDTGVGIRADQLPRIFERFYQGDASSTRPHEGTGIGLALARELVELHGGRIHAESSPGVGSAFRVHLPRDAAVEHASAHAPTSPARQLPLVEAEERDSGEPAGAADLDEDRTTVLVVDDNRDVRAYVRSILAPSFRVIEAADGISALELARSALPDLIVADVMMPRMDGLELGRALKGDPMTDTIPVVLLTARAAPKDQIAGLETGADAYIVKPFDPGVLEASVANLLAQRRRLRERFRTGEAVPPETVATNSPAPSALEQQLTTIVEAHLTDPDFGPEALADAASLSYHQLYRALRTELDTTPSRFIRGVRVACADELLRRGAGSVTEVAYSVGFESLSYFSRAFHERFGTPPSGRLALHARS